MPAEGIKSECVGQGVFKNVQLWQQVVKIVHDRLFGILGDERSTLNAQRALNILLVELQGSGRTTTAEKLALCLKGKMRILGRLPATFTAHASPLSEFSSKNASKISLIFG